MDEKQVQEETENQETTLQGPNSNQNESQPTQDVQQEAQEELNYRALRELKEKAERERDELRIKLEQTQKIQQQEPVPPQPTENQDFYVNPDDLVEGKHLSAVNKKVKQLEEQLQAYQQQSTVNTVEARLKAQHPDFDQVVSKENIEIFRTAYPELAAAIGSSSDIYSKGMSAYTLIKKFGIHQAQANAGAVDRVKQNLSKPTSSASIGTQQGDSPLSKANAFADGLTPELKQKLYREMVESSKRN